MGKSDPLKDKPKAPNRQQIYDDLSNAHPDDVVFRLSMKDCPHITSSIPETSNSTTALSAQAGQSSSDKDLDDAYDKVTRLIDMHEKLQKEPTLLNEKYELLGHLGKEVAESISKLKSAAESLSHSGSKDKI